MGAYFMDGVKKRIRFKEDLTGKKFGRLTVLESSEKRGSRGKRTVPLWRCICDCGETVYKATDTLKGRECSMCAKCAAQNATSKMRQAAGFVNGTQISRIKSSRLSVSNTSGVKGVYYDKRSGKWRARLKFKGKLMNFGSFDNFEDAVKARKNAELEYFGEFLDKN